MIWRGELYDLDLGQPVGHEPAFERPAVVVSSDIVNNSPGQLVIVVPVSTRAYGLRSHVELDAASTGLGGPSFARCDQIRVVSTRRLLGRRGQVPVEQMQSIDRALQFILDL